MSGNGNGMAIRPTEFEVESETKAGVTYTVWLPYCSCPDFRYRRTTPGNPFCKHLLRAFELGGWHLPERTEGLTSDEVAGLLGRHGVNKHAVAVVIQNARAQGGSAVPVDGYDTLAVITYSRSGGLFTVALP